MPAPSIRSMGTVTSGSTATPTFAEPAGAQPDDVIVCGWFQDDARTSISPVLPTGFAAAFDAPQANNPLTGSSPDHSLQVFVARRSVCGAGPYAFTVVAGLGGATPFCEGLAVAVQDVPASIASPFTEAADGNTSGSSSSATAPLVSATSLGALRLALYFATNWTGGAWTPPSGYTEDWDANNRIATLDHLTMAAPATTSPQAVNASSDRTNAWVGIFASLTAADPGYTSRIPLTLLRTLLSRRQALLDALQTAQTSSGSGSASARTSTTSSGIKGAAASALPTARTATTETGVRKATGSGTPSARTSTAESGVKGGQGAGLPTARSTTVDTGVKKATGAGLPSARTATQASTAAIPGGPALPSARTSTTSSGKHGGLGAAVASARTSATDTGVKKATGAATPTARTSTASSGRRGATGAARASARTETVAAGGAVGVLVPIGEWTIGQGEPLWTIEQGRPRWRISQA